MKLMLKPFAMAFFGAFVLLTGCSKDEIDIENLRVPRLMLETRGISYGNLIGKQVELPLTKAKIAVRSQPLVNEFEIINAELVKVELGHALLLQLTERGSRALYRASVSSNGDRVVLLINGNAVGARRLDGAITNGDFYTFVELPDDELEELVMELKESIVKIQKPK